MKSKRSLLDDLCIKEYRDDIGGALDIDTEKIRRMVNDSIFDVSAERKSITMKSKKKTVFIAVAAVFILGITAFAASGIVSTRESSSSARSEYKSLPTAKQITKDIGYTPALINEFKNGYTFSDGSVVKNRFKDESGNTIEKFKSVTFRYEKDGDKVFLSQDKFNSETEKEGEVILTVGDTDIYYYSYINKTVPPDYKMTDADKQAEQSGEVIFSYGSSDISVSKVQSVSWNKDGIVCNLLQLDGKLTAEQMAEMAKEIIGE